MAKDAPRILLLDDEENIRLLLGMYLRQQGFDLTAAGTVPEALKLIAEEQFDVLIADLNVGHPGDGFTVVSAMRRTQPQTITFILTGYPAFETALQAIRLQVDDYVTKPTDTDALVEKIRAKLANPRTHHRIEPKRLSEIISDNLSAITRDWLEASEKDPELAAINLTHAQRMDHIPRVLEVVLRVSRGDQITDADRNAARDHGVTRRKQGFTVPLLIREARLLNDAISSCMQSNLLAVQISYLISDLISIERTKNVLLEESVAAFLKGKR